MESPSINNTWLRRYTVLASIALLKRIRPRSGIVLMLTDNICVKYGPHVHLAEASAVRFVAQNTSIPVPKIYCSFTHRGWTYIVMERIHGTYLAQGWVHRSEESKAKILSKLKSLLQQLRTLSPPGPGISNVDGGSLYDCRLPGTSSRFGPFETVQDFHKYLRGGMKTHPDVDPEVNQLIEQQDGPWPPPSFTHGDLSSFNILASGDDVVGIIDWETAGWLPSYWEYTTACYVNPRNTFWRDEIDKFLDPMPKELAMEKIRQKYWGDF